MYLKEHVSCITDYFYFDSDTPIPIVSTLHYIANNIQDIHNILSTPKKHPSLHSFTKPQLQEIKSILNILKRHILPPPRVNVINTLKDYSYNNPPRTSSKH